MHSPGFRGFSPGHRAVTLGGLTALLLILTVLPAAATSNTSGGNHHQGPFLQGTFQQGSSSSSSPRSRGVRTASVQTAIPLSGFYQMVVDDAHQHVFVSGQFDDQVMVMNFDGSEAADLTGMPEASGLALDAVNHVVYVAEHAGNAIAAIDTDTLTVTRTYPLGTDNCPYDLALAGGKLWFTAACPGPEFLGSLDLDSGTVATYSRGSEGTAMLLATVPTNPSMLLLGEKGDPANLIEYDVAGAAPRQLAEVSTYSAGVPGAMSDLRVAPDGLTAISAGPPLAAPTWNVDKLTRGSVTYPVRADLSGAVAVTADGAFVAVGVADTPYPLDNIRIYPAAGGSPVTVLRAGALNSGALFQRALAFSQDGSRLFAVSYHLSPGGSDFDVFDDPTTPSSTLTIDASPSTVPVNDRVTFSGTLSFLDSSSPAGSIVRVMGYGPALEQLPDFTVGADGAFSVHDTPFAPGTYTYEVIFAGDQSHRGTVASTTVVVTDPNSTAGTLTLSTSTNTLPHKGKVTVTAQLQSPTSTKNKTVDIVKLPAGGKPPTTVTGTIDKNGNFSTTFTLIRTATFHATWSGDATHEFTTSGSETVSTYALTEESLGGSYGKSGSYFLYHYSSTCAATQETGCILAAGQVVPWNEVAELCYTWEQNVGSGWTDGQTVCGELDEHGQATLILSYDDDSAIGVKFRVQATFEGSISNLSSSSPWVYFKITS